MERQQRRLAAVLAADVAGYSRLMAADEGGTLARLKALRAELIDPAVERYGGRVVGSAGDSLLVEFGSATAAVTCGAEMQEKLAALNAALPEDRRMKFRMGVNLGEVIIDGATIHGDGVNVAARLEKLAEPGELVIAGIVHDQVKGKVSYGFDDLGEKTLHNIEVPVRFYRVTRAGAADGVPKSAPLPLPDRASIAVLPFTNMSGDPEQTYFSDGITEDIITELSKFGELFVVARHSTFAFRGSSKAVPEIARALGVGFVVEGSVRKSKDRVRVTAQLIDAATGNHAWAERYDRALDDIFAVQDEITRSIVSALPGRIAAALASKSRRKPTESLDAYDCLLRAQELMESYRSDDMAHQKALLERAVELDPGFARAYAWLSDVHMRSWWISNSPLDLEAADATSARAVRLDEQDSLCHSQRGFTLLFQRDYDTALHHFERASELNPNDANGAVTMAIFLLYSGRAEDAIEHVRRAMHYNPLYPQWYLEVLGLAFIVSRRYEEAVKVLSGLRDPAYYVHGFLAGCLAKLGRLDEARLHRGKMFEKKPDWTPEHYRMDPYKNPEDIEHVGELMRLAAAAV